MAKGKKAVAAEVEKALAAARSGGSGGGSGGHRGGGSGGKSGSGPDGGIPQSAVRIGGAVLTGIGVVGLATLVGGGIMFMRFQFLGLPTEQALSVVPKNEMLGIGAETLLPLTFAVLLAVLVVRSVLVRLPKTLTWLRAKRRRQFFIGVGFALIATWGYYWIAIGDVDIDTSTVLIGAIAAAGGAICAAVGMPAPDEHQWGWFAVTVILVVAGVSTGIAWRRTYDDPMARAAAVLRQKDDHGIAGLFVAETSDRVYLARVTDLGRSHRGVNGTGRLISVPIDQASELAIGQNQDLPAALDSARTLLSELRLCRSPAGTCGRGLPNLSPGFDPSASDVQLSVLSVHLHARSPLNVTVKNQNQFGVSVRGIAVVATEAGLSTKHRVSTRVFSNARIVPIKPVKSMTIDLVRRSGLPKWLRRAHRVILKITAHVQAPDGTRAVVVKLTKATA